MAFAIKSTFDPIGLITGGFSGIGIMLKRLTEDVLDGGIPIWLTNLVLNIPLFVAAYKVKGRKFIGKTMAASLLLTLWLGVIPDCDLAGGDYLLASVYGGVLTGAGIGLVLSAQVATGGTDLIATLLHQKFRSYSIAQLLQVIDGAIILAGIYVCGIHASLYAIFAVFVTTRVSDLITEGGKFAKAVYIVSEKDKVFLVGDFSAYGLEKSREICHQLNGEKFLVMGNHDTQNEQYYYECGFSGVSRYPIIYENFWLVSHEPLYINKNMPYANIFGHVHANPIYADFSEQSFCVSAERINYTPVAFSEIKRSIREKENKI